MQAVKKRDAEKLIGKRIYAIRKDGAMVTGKLVRIQGNHLIVAPMNKKVRTSAFIPLVLFDLLAIGTYGGGFGGYPGYGFGGYPGYGFGGPFFW